MQAQILTTTRLRLATGLALILALAGCENLPTPVAPSESGGMAASSTPAPERDVVRTDLFSVTETAIWDGRPTFGGVWVAYAGDIQPERVRITNRANGKTIIGALFRRERETPGPSIQVSADAASALGIVAGTPVEMTVTALRREAVETPAPATPATPVPETPSPEGPAATAPAEPAAPSEDRPVARTTPAAAPITAAPLEPAVAPAAAPAGAPARPYVQVGTFATQSNANDLVTILGTNSVTAGVRQVEVDGRTLYRVVAGPADSAAALTALVARLKGLGYADVFPIR